ncbi:MAG: translation elongation factor 4 [bacterium]
MAREVRARKNTRNFGIIAHIDHGKSTLADRILEITGTIPKNELKPQHLDRLEVERERGVTVKMQAVQIDYTASDGELYHLNLIDTPGHVDFSYEVSRSLAACEGVLLLVDAVQGVEAQTIANYMLALSENLVIIPVINKIDLPAADISRVSEEMKEALDIHPGDILLASAKEGRGVCEVLDAVVSRIPPPSIEEGETRSIIFDSHYDTFRGVVAYVRVFSGALRKGDMITLMSSGRRYEISEIGVFKPEMSPRERLDSGDVGYLIAGIKEPGEVRIGDTVTLAEGPASKPLPGYKKLVPMVYAGYFPSEGESFENLRAALMKFGLNDPSLVFEHERSGIFGYGYRCGFLGLFHMEIVQERLEREYEVSIVATAPTVVYRVFLREDEYIEIKNPTEYPENRKLLKVQEPYVRLTVVAPVEFIGAVMELCREKRGEFRNTEYLSEKRVSLEYLLPLSEVIFDFFDRLKSCTRGYGSMNYEFASYLDSDLVKLKILVGGREADSLSLIVHRDEAYRRGRRIVERLRKAIPRHQFEVSVQAAVGSRVIARETIPPMRKNVTAKCYGGDVTRKRKLIEKQKAGKKRLKNVGNVRIPQEAFLAILDTVREKQP